MLYLSPGEMYEFRSLMKHEQDPTCAPGLTHVLFYKHLTFQIQSLKICLKMWISDSQVLKFDKFWVLSLKIQSLKRCLMGQTRYEMDYKSNNLLRWMRKNKCERQSYKCIHESRVGMPLEILNTYDQLN